MTDKICDIVGCNEKRMGIYVRGSCVGVGLCSNHKHDDDYIDTGDN